ncbi:hypothetical protein [Kitasatospora sp. LaBMicrA B282]
MPDVTGGKAGHPAEAPDATPADTPVPTPASEDDADTSDTGDDA